MVTENINVLAHSVFSNKGVFALLLGSGISRSAEIPTGWEITLDLIRQIAALEGEKTCERPDEWFIKNKGKQPDYASLLESLPGTADERQAIIRNYIEPTEEDRQDGRKIPTKAHHAIAELAQQGYIRVILTTNFDRLLENALSQKGVEPIVISSDDDVKGAPPITHGRCFIIKIHGDYLDTRIKNTPEELGSYSEGMNKYLDSIFDHFGLIVCGWSGAWDTSLRNAIKRCPSRRYTTFWTTRGNVRPEARELVVKRDAKVIDIDNADKFFDDLKEKVRALEELQKPAPMNTRMATAMIKRYLAEERHRIRLRDTVLEQSKITNEVLRSANFDPHTPTSAEEIKKRLNFYEGNTEILRAILTVGSYWSTSSQNELWIDIIKRQYANNQVRSGLTTWLDLDEKYTSMLSFYCAGVACVAGKNFNLLNELMSTQLRGRSSENTKSFSELLYPAKINAFHEICRNMQGFENKIYTSSEYLLAVLKDTLYEIEPDERQIDIYFDIFESLLGLAYGYERHKKGLELDWFPFGKFVLRYGSDYGASEVRDFISEADIQQSNWLPVKAGMFGGSYENFKSVQEKYDPFIRKVANSRW